MTKSNLTLFAAAFALGSSALAVPTTQYGQSTTWPAGFFADGSNFGAEANIRSGTLATPNVQTWTAIGLPATADRPNYGNVHELYSGTAEVLDMEINAHCTSNSNVPTFFFDSAFGQVGSPKLTNDQWFGIGLSLDADSNGKQGSLFRFGGVEVVGYYFENSGTLPGSFLGRAMIEYRRNSLGLNGDADAYLRALDYGMGFVTYESTGLPDGMFRNSDHYYFSVSKDFATDFFDSPPPSPFGETESGAPLDYPHAGDIYRRDWDQASHTWSVPIRHIRYTELDLSDTNGDVDALLYNDLNNVVIFSVAGSSDEAFDGDVTERSQLMVTDTDLSGPPVPLRDASGTKVTDKTKIRDLGGGDDDAVTSVCGIDPEFTDPDARAGFPHLNAQTTVPDPMGLSIARGRWGDPDTGDGSEIAITVSGWGGITTSGGTVQLQKRDFNSPNWSLVAFQPRRVPPVVSTSYIPVNSFVLPVNSTFQYQDVVYRAVFTSATTGQTTESIHLTLEE